MNETKYDEYDNDGNKIEVTVLCDYDLPFYRYLKIKKVNQTTGKMEIQQKFSKKTVNEMVQDAMIVTAGATAINQVGNGLSHLIYSIKKKNGGKKK